MFDLIVDVAGSELAGATKGIRSTRRRRRASVRVREVDAPSYSAEVGARREAEPHASS